VRLEYGSRRAGERFGTGLPAEADPSGVPREGGHQSHTDPMSVVAALGLAWVMQGGANASDGTSTPRPRKPAGPRSPCGYNPPKRVVIVTRAIRVLVVEDDPLIA